MPGKQMAIDAELNAGAIDEPVARRRANISFGKRNFTGPWMVPASSCAATPLPA